MKITFYEITDINDALFMPWLDLYETAFPPEEKILVSGFFRFLNPDIKEDGVESRLIAALDERGEFAGLMFYRTKPEIYAFALWYLATLPALRGSGVGAGCYDEVVRRAKESGAKFVVFEVEVPEDSPDADIARRRIEFYRRRGAKLLRGIRMLQKIGDHTRTVQMNIMVHSFEPISPQQAFEIAVKYVDNEGISQIGELSLE